MALPFEAFMSRAKAFCELPFATLPSADLMPGFAAKDFAGKWGSAASSGSASGVKRFAGSCGCSAEVGGVCPSSGWLPCCSKALLPEASGICCCCCNQATELSANQDEDTMKLEKSSWVERYGFSGASEHASPKLLQHLMAAAATLAVAKVWTTPVVQLYMVDEGHCSRQQLLLKQWLLLLPKAQTVSASAAWFAEIISANNSCCFSKPGCCYSKGTDSVSERTTTCQAVCKHDCIESKLSLLHSPAICGTSLSV